ncbi:hypothetical protein K438DRAFT_1759156 [Mycena galopus ATCC 62051]|nr:hypothetical protein K438DRAFT_1759156 [Mycena galopus ATCC 62051]
MAAMRPSRTIKSKAIGNNYNFYSYLAHLTTHLNPKICEDSHCVKCKLTRTNVCLGSKWTLVWYDFKGYHSFIALVPLIFHLQIAQPGKQLFKNVLNSFLNVCFRFRLFYLSAQTKRKGWSLRWGRALGCQHSCVRAVGVNVRSAHKDRAVHSRGWIMGGRDSAYRPSKQERTDVGNGTDIGVAVKNKAVRRPKKIKEVDSEASDAPSQNTHAKMCQQRREVQAEIDQEVANHVLAQELEYAETEEIQRRLDRLSDKPEVETQ